MPIEASASLVDSQKQSRNGRDLLPDLQPVEAGALG
jgi:hypothetical protein